jgi:hypothetical protein
MSYNYNKLLGKIKEVFGTQDNFARALGLSRTSFSLRINGKAEFSQTEIDKAVNLLGLNDKDIPSIFFSKSLEN